MAKTTPKMQQFCLKWKYHNANIQTTFSALRERASFCDVTLWCGGAAMRAHRAVLAACSGLFCELLANHDLSLGEPAIVLTDTMHAYHLRHILTFMYSGEVSVHHAELASLLKTAEELQIKGLADVSWKDPNIKSQCSSGVVTEISSSPPSPNSSHIVSKSDDEGTCKIMSKTGSVSFVSTNAINGSSVLVPVINSEPSRRRRGRPPLEPKLNHCENEIVIPDPPKRPKMSAMPNILRKSKLEPKTDSPVIDMTSDWSVSTDKPNDDEALSDCSDNSLDGPDISQFLDTQMEEEPSDVTVTLPGKQIMLANDHGSNDGESERQQTKENPLFTDVVKLSDYLMSGRRTQFWTEDYVKRVMEAVFCRELEMKQAAEILGVSYGTLYGRYRDTFGCINRPYRAREFWAENSDVLAKLQKQEISFLKAAELLNITPQMLFTYVNSVSEPVINQKEASDIFTDAITRANAKTDTKTTDEDKNTDIGKNPESFNRLSDILRKYHQVQEVGDDDDDVDKKDDEKIPVVDITSSGEAEEKSDKREEEKEIIKEPKVINLVSEPSSSNSNQNSTKKMPLIRVANLKFLKGDAPGPLNISDLGDKPAIIVKGVTPINYPDLKMITSKRKVTFEEIECSLKHSKKISLKQYDKKNPVPQPQEPIT